MNGIKILANTNAFIGVLNETPVLAPFLDYHWHYCFITKIELLNKTDLSKAQEEEILLTLAEADALTYNDAVETQAIAIRRKYLCKLPDAIIAATAMQYDLSLLTFDRDFVRVEGLDLIMLELA